ncbi:MAG: type IV pilin protein [Ketobacteraceae bacterium]|nr:type IV pilin protein [Ketobacteraceae bacterium]
MHTKSNRGFTLIELMIAVAIIGILAAVAYPSYMSSVRKSKLGDAKAALSEMAKAMERRYTERVPGDYGNLAQGGADTGPPAADFFPATAPLDSNEQYYRLNIDSADAAGYVLSATAIPGANLDPNCTPLTLSSNGTRTPSGCW